ncbi:Uncharacterised protein [Streptococcus pneumoniae]|nr:hypothetical protein [Streptococcus pneumoniae]CXG66356.1 Uncharacterised protein [Streptococcus pneumoniae]
MANTPIKPGTDNQKPGRYVEVGPRGGKVTNGHTATIGNIMVNHFIPSSY